MCSMLPFLSFASPPPSVHTLLIDVPRKLAPRPSLLDYTHGRGVDSIQLRRYWPRRSTVTHSNSRWTLVWTSKVCYWSTLIVQERTTCEWSNSTI